MRKRVLWIVNTMPPTIANKLHQASSNKEGWLDGLLRVFIDSVAIDSIQLGIAAPCGCLEEPISEHVAVHEDYDVYAYQFREDALMAHEYSMQTEEELAGIIEDFQPDVLHCFGTEYPHTLAAVKRFGKPDQTLIGIQGLCSVYAGGYMANLPRKIQKKVTFRDFVRKDSLVLQQEKYTNRGYFEILALKSVKHVTGRTHWDAYYAKKWNEKITYHKMNETLRSNFYDKAWSAETCIKHQIFLSQGDYPIKGLHYMLLALPMILAKYPDTTLCVAGNSLLRGKGIKARLKISAYGQYLASILAELNLTSVVTFLGKLNANEMLQGYLKSHLFVCPSTMENSPNSLGEAMLLGMPIVTSDIGGIQSMISDDECIFYEGFREERAEEEEELMRITRRLAEAVIQAFDMDEEAIQMGMRAKSHALKTHDRQANFEQLLDIYGRI